MIKRKFSKVSPAVTENAGSEKLILVYHEQIIEDDPEMNFESSSGEIWQEGTICRLYYDDSICCTSYHGVIQFDTSFLPTVFQFFDSNNTDSTFAKYLHDKGGDLTHLDRDGKEVNTITNAIVPSEPTIQLPF